MGRVTVVRYAVPALLFVAGVVMFAIEPNDLGLEALAMATGAALSVLLLNWFFRAGVRGDQDRAREEAAREYFAHYGRWPDEDR
jgi:hypothetical protein